jgi:hypothetical protein
MPGYPHDLQSGRVQTRSCFAPSGCASAPWCTCVTIGLEAKCPDSQVDSQPATAIVASIPALRRLKRLRAAICISTSSDRRPCSRSARSMRSSKGQKTETAGLSGHGRPKTKSPVITGPCVPTMVRVVGLEPTLLAETEFESVASTIPPHPHIPNARLVDAGLNA